MNTAKRRGAQRNDWFPTHRTVISVTKREQQPIKGGENQRCVLTVAEALMAENELLTPSEVAVMFRVNPKTVTRWARAGKISAVRTLGGHRRFRASEIRRFLEEVGDLQA